MRLGRSLMEKSDCQKTPDAISKVRIRRKSTSIKIHVGKGIRGGNL